MSVPHRGPPSWRPRGRPVTGGQYRNRREIRLRVDWCCCGVQSGLVLQTRERNGRQEAFVQWAGYPISQSTWEPATEPAIARLLSLAAGDD